MTRSQCAICGPGVPSRLVYPNRMASGSLEVESFSARRVPDRVHAEIRRCDTCGLLFAASVPDTDELARLYGESRMTYGDEIDNLRRTYGALLTRVVRDHGAGGRLLEVGCGTGFLLDEALDRGFVDVAGVEPSVDAIAAAPARVRDRIHPGLFHDDLFAAAQFDVVCGFHVFDHLADPRQFLAGVRRILKPAGVLVLVMHDAGAWSAALLGERSPIFDVVHPYLYDRATIARMLAAGGFETIELSTLRNTYSLAYWAHLTPTPTALQPWVRRVLGAGPGRLRIRLSAGNMTVMARATPLAGPARG